MTPRAKIALAVLVILVAAMGYYAFRLKRQAERLPIRAFDTRPIAPPISGPTERVTLTRRELETLIDEAVRRDRTLR